ncbi:MAG: hypothetical protein QOI12_370 [Alphaproteobacteria bacterium]|jgi:transcription elongation factor Elf1|nr:hypothetical protein [Alphaproteobacteria bacterium]
MRVQVHSKPAPSPQPPPCPQCGSKMRLTGVDPSASKYTNLDQWSYRCDPCGQSMSCYVARANEE